jgi:hypothetical protein
MSMAADSRLQVWADGLGNPFENALFACQIASVAKLCMSIDTSTEASSTMTEQSSSIQGSEAHSSHVATGELNHSKGAIDGGSASTPKNTASKINDGKETLSKEVLVWIDTLCCPINAKDLALAKIRDVYEKATYTLVLDSSLRCVSARAMGLHEVIIRISTSSWMRRLWTLQEAALSKDLWFQFSNEVISFAKVWERKIKTQDHYPELRGIGDDTNQEVRHLGIYFRAHEYGLPGPDTAHLDFSLKHRSVSVAIDEPVCITTLMSLSMSSLLEAPPGESRMREAWRMIAALKCGIPAGIIFLNDICLQEPGWRWAPRSLLGGKANIKDTLTRNLLLSRPQKGIPTPHGLRVQFRGFRFFQRQCYDGLPRNPWKGPGLKRIPESSVDFRDGQNRWYRMGDYHTIDDDSDRRKFTAEEQAAWQARGSHPLHSMTESGNAAIIFPSELVPAPGLLTAMSEGIIVSVKEHVDGGLAVRNEALGIICLLPPEQGFVYETIETLAKELRTHEVTRNLLMVKDLESEQYKVAIAAVKEEMKRSMKQALEKSQRLVDAIIKYIDDDILDYIWVMIGDWYNADIIGEMLPVDQTWYVD